MKRQAAKAQVTQLLRHARAGDVEARDHVLELIHAELHLIARRQLRGEKHQTLQATGLVNEAYLELFGPGGGDWEDRNHFFAYSATVMRHILVREARRRQAAKRGGGQLRVTLEGLSGEQFEEDLIALDEALEKLARIDERKSRLIELRYFGGLTIKELCALESLSPATVHKDLKTARGWLFHELGQ